MDGKSLPRLRLVLIILWCNVALQETEGWNYVANFNNNDKDMRIDWEVDDDKVAYEDEIFFNKKEDKMAYEEGKLYEELADDKDQEGELKLDGESGSSTSNEINEGTGKITFRWPSGTVPYVINETCYDSIISDRIRQAMLTIQRSSCVVFKDMSHYSKHKLKDFHTPWLSITNPDKTRECTHNTSWTSQREVRLVIGYDCIQPRDIMHSLMHALGFPDEVTHPQRDLYIRVVWPNIQLKYRPLFYVHKNETPNKTMEFDSMSVMHFHDRAYTINGGPTILPQIPGLLIAPSDSLSQLDVMKLRLAFGHECNKRKVASILRNCLSVLTKDDV